MSKKAIAYFALCIVFIGTGLSPLFGLMMNPTVRSVDLLTLIASSFAAGGFFVLAMKARKKSTPQE